MDLQSAAADPAKSLPNLKAGFILAGIIFVAELVWGVQKELARGLPHSESAGGYAAALSLVGAIVSTAFVLHCISSYHYVLSDVEGWSHPITPRRAVRFHFIPIFNLYWDFKWPHEIAKFVNWRLQRHRMSGFLVGAWVLSGFSVGAFFDVSVGLVLILSAFAYLSRCLRDALAAPGVPLEAQATNRLDATTYPI
ncbi:MAG: hypothetical protein ACRD2S_01955 [Terriglobales bacterium]